MIAITAILIALMLPVVQKAREAARKIKATGGSEYGLAVTSYVASNSSYGLKKDQGLISILGCGAAPINANASSGQGRIAFSSRHVGGAYSLFGDGRIKFLSENIDHKAATIANDSPERQFRRRRRRRRGTIQRNDPCEIEHKVHTDRRSQSGRKRIRLPAHFEIEIVSKPEFNEDCTSSPAPYQIQNPDPEIKFWTW